MTTQCNQNASSSRDFDVAAVLVGIILVFIVCHSFKFFVNCYEAYIMHFGESGNETVILPECSLSALDRKVQRYSVLLGCNSPRTFLRWNLKWRDGKRA